MTHDTDVPEARREVIAGRLARGEPVVASALAVEFGLSDDAIRRDLRALAATGRCRRVYGGALPPSADARPVAARATEGHARKEALARRAAATIAPGEFLFLDTSSAHLLLVEHLPEDQGLTVATNSVDVAAAILRRGDLPLVMIGGAVDPAVGGCIDATAVRALESMTFDRSFLGTCAVSVDTGLGAVHHADAVFKRALVAASRARIALVTDDKLGARAPHRVAAMDAIEALVVEHSAPPRTVEALRRAGATVLRADRSA